MKRFIGLGAGCALVTGALLLTASPARADATQSTVTFKLTLNGQVPANDSFIADWTNGIGVLMCSRSGSNVATPPPHCVGGGRTFVATFPFGKNFGPVHFFFLRFNSISNVTGPPKQTFGNQTANPNTNPTVSAVFTYGSATTTVATPSTGSAGLLGIGAGLLGTGTAVTLLALRSRRRQEDESRAGVLTQAAIYPVEGTISQSGRRSR
jgi:hypothetical protein